MNAPKEMLFVTGSLIVFLFVMCVSVVNQREYYRKLLIDFGHARHTIDPVTGVSKFDIDSAPNKTSK